METDYNTTMSQWPVPKEVVVGNVAETSHASGIGALSYETVVIV